MKKLELWMESLGKSQDKLGKHSICPYINRYKDKILLIPSKKPFTIAKSFATFKDLFNLEAVVVYDFWLDWDKMVRATELCNDQLNTKDVEVLMMHPDSTDAPLGFEYTFEDSPLLIVQRRSTLERARKSLQENSDYYTYFRE